MGGNPPHLLHIRYQFPPHETPFTQPREPIPLTGHHTAPLHSTHREFLPAWKDALRMPRKESRRGSAQGFLCQSRPQVLGTKILRQEGVFNSIVIIGDPLRKVVFRCCLWGCMFGGGRFVLKRNDLNTFATT